MIITHLAAAPGGLIRLRARGAISVAHLTVVAGVLADVVDERAAPLLLILDAGQTGIVAMRSLRAVVLTAVAIKLAAAAGLSISDAERTLIVAMLTLWADVEAALHTVHTAGCGLLVGHTSGAVWVATLVVRAGIKAFITFGLTIPLRLVLRDAILAFGVAMEPLVAAVQAALTLDSTGAVPWLLVSNAGAAVWIATKPIGALIAALVVVDQLADVTGLRNRHTVGAFRTAPLPIGAIVLTDAAWVLAHAALGRLTGSARGITDLTVRAIVTALVIDDLT